MLHGTQGQVSPFEVDELRKEMGGWSGGGEKKAAFRGNENSGLFQLFHPLPLPLLRIGGSTKAVWN